MFVGVNCFHVCSVSRMYNQALGTAWSAQCINEENQSLCSALQKCTSYPELTR
jgi:hypothetical protein